MYVVQLLLEACVLFRLTYLQGIKTHSTLPKKIGVYYKNPGFSQELKNKTQIVASLEMGGGFGSKPGFGESI